MAGKFSLLLGKSSRERGSRIVLALDVVDEAGRLVDRCLSILEQTSPHICAVKLNRHVVLPLGLEKTATLVEEIHGLGLPAIMDCKLNDIGSTNQVIAKHYFDAGFDALTANPFVGWEGGLKPVFELARKLDRGVLLLVYMSHPGAAEGYGQKVVDESGQARPQYLVFAEKALEWRADGVVVGATHPEKIEEVRMVLGSGVPIFSPGVGVQGGRVEHAVRAGASYLIVGRSIIMAESPGRVAEELKERANRALGGL
mgnify:CR=1 FL=1